MNKFQMTREMPKQWEREALCSAGMPQQSIHPKGRRGRLLSDETTELYGRPSKKKVKK